ncbi:uncharacterized protein FA14DRAFT_161111 [Meira miltonrushii]|uniref:Uncharacterized protein n=1 Tax=Meira miltonrushii TaxID=1280837 RepID=A0A316VH63_9BASI|nr:uncharacterized protein FA14DRAFT_161111 [Meira miltonrushii]PWN36368.1 hypothetical protein FA14DRAFT_161111 [Meira miltonrushii]
MVKQKVEHRHDLWCEANLIANQYKSPEKEKAAFPERHFLSRSETVPRHTGKSLNLPSPPPQSPQDHDDSGGTSTTPTRFTSNMTNFSPLSPQFAHRPDRPKPGQQRGAGGYDDRLSVSEYSLASPVTYSFASNDMNTPSSISTSFVSTPSPINGWKVCSENREPAVRDCVSSLSVSAPAHSSSSTILRSESSTNGQSEFKKSVDLNILQTSYRGSTDEGKQRLHSTVYASTKTVKKKPVNASDKFGQQRIPLAIKSIGASRSFDLLRRNGSNSPHTVNNTADGEYINSKDSKLNKIRRKSSLGFQSIQQRQVQKNEGLVDAEAVGRSSPRSNILRRLRANTSVAESDSQSITSPRMTSSHFPQSDGYDRMQATTPTSSPWTLVATGLEDDHTIPQQQQYPPQKRVNFETDIINRVF